MATKVVMAQLSPTMEEGRLIEWKVAEGETVAQGDIVAEIETDKANMEVEALGSGVLRKIVVEAGQTVPVGTLIGVIAEPDESIDELLASADADALAMASTTAPAQSESTAPAPEEATQPDEVGQLEEATEISGAAETSASADARAKASPVARRIAAEGGLDLKQIAGSGPGGRIVKADVEASLSAATPPGPVSGPTPTSAPDAPATSTPASSAPASSARATTSAPTPPALASPGLEGRLEEASQMRKAIARRLVQSIGPVPHFFLTIEVDMGRALELRADLNARLSEGKIGVNDLLLKATAGALTRHPGANASWEDGSIRYHGRADIGIAVALDEGLITPVLRDAGRKGLLQISFEARDLISRARDRKLSPEEYQGGTFSVSNLGMSEIEEFTAIINPPESGILAIGRTAEKPVVVDGQVVVRKRMRVTMSCDHRIIDGASGAVFLETFKAMLENPLEMML